MTTWADVWGELVPGLLGCLLIIVLVDLLFSWARAVAGPGEEDTGVPDE